MGLRVWGLGFRGFQLGNGALWKGFGSGGLGPSVFRGCFKAVGLFGGYLGSSWGCLGGWGFGEGGGRGFL